ncbi:hypothetical protein [Robinsoniella peoriensis]|uniref:Uncharacterized protein n=1 Tax=Robinsoniella peoriensis TaxID=180332 RepID=A0A4U8QCH3_9FIRM|nr:hypothetical protein [Robinsoniella peoriensis]TLC99645.1 hypothetical protein DSM106044_03437 [Robinsoniella peoriensis]
MISYEKLDEKELEITVTPDEWDLRMIDQATKENDGNTISFDEICHQLNIKEV